jgi:hypothetical protein
MRAPLTFCLSCHTYLTFDLEITTTMDAATKQDAFHTSTYNAAGTAMMSFGPINAIHQHLCAFHVYACVHISALCCKVAHSTSQARPHTSCSRAPLLQASVS